MDAVSQSYDVTIVGGGLVGATLALLLATKKIRVALIEAGHFSEETVDSQPVIETTTNESTMDDQEHLTFDPRVVALTLASENLFKNLGVWPAVEEARTSPYSAMTVWDGSGTGAIDFQAHEANVEHIGTIVENSTLLLALRKKLLELDDVFILENTKVTQLGPVAEHLGESVRFIGLDDGQVITTRVLVAADGALSSVRQMAAFSMREWSYNHHAIVTTVKTELPHESTARQVFMDEGPLAFLPLRSKDGDCHYCSIVWSQVPERANHLLSLTDQAFCKEIERAFESRLGAVEWVDRRFSIPLKQRHAKQYVKDRIVLVGDAAHTIHPLAGQGVNLGLLDAAVLAEEMNQAASDGLDPGSERTLKRYQRRRMGHNLSMMSLMEGFKQLFSESAPPVRFLRNFGMSLLNQHPLLKRPILTRALGLEGDLPDITKK